ncbi:pyridoxal phosphate-dependent aminotransferase [Miltoncostaea oceani]|jgi:aspartate/methionine/tyrosine aminotransferase|uniref:pyridoxal phosphate-dependent aminotransferase n=1 Tax=Miltoncostaea oceani TaxID=2843216 RepID=UPI001C3D2ADF|nr:pyridoxal phosphate-dependent aminotransferase [Miltoncostaea oceani]
MARARSVLTWRPPAPADVPLASERARAVLADPQGFGNYMTYRDAYRILGWDPADVYRDGAIALDRAEWADLGWMANHIGPSPRALDAMRGAVDAEHVGPYSPDLDEPLRDLMATRLLGRARDDGFDVIGTEGAQAGVGYAALACIDPGDEVIVTDPGYFHFVPALRLAGGVPVWVDLAASSGWRLDPDAVAAALTPRTKMIVVCDPVNPFGTVQRRDELDALLALSEEHGIVILADTTHSSHRVDPAARHHPVADVQRGRPGATLLVSSGLAHGHGMAGARIGALGGDPALVRACLQVKIAAVRLNTNRVAQVGAAAALVDDAWLRGGEEVIRGNLARLRAIATPVIDPSYGFSCVVDVSGTGASAQELTVALCARHIAVYPGDGLGDVGATTTIRVNLSDPDPSALERLAGAWDDACAEAASGVYREAVRDLFLSYGTARGRRIADVVAAGTGR